MNKMFETTELNGMIMANRFVRSATWEGMASEDGGVTPRLIETMVNLARGGIGLIITSHAYVRPEGQAGPWQLGVYKDELIPGLKELTSAVHDAGGKVVMQLAHAGAAALDKLTGQLPLGVSAFDRPAGPVREMSGQDIREIIKAFADGARRAKAAGFDGVQLHSGHGYLLSQFLSPAFNRRQDEYGGEIENRCRIHVEICRKIRKEIGGNYPLLVKMNCEDFIENGLILDDSLKAGLAMAKAGVDAIEVSGGVFNGRKLSPSRPAINSEEREAYFREQARRFKNLLNIPIILVGGMRSYTVAESMVEGGTADYISFSRPLICEPDLVNRWKSGDRSKAKCISDNQCFAAGRSGRGIYCAVNENNHRENGLLG